MNSDVIRQRKIVRVGKKEKSRHQHEFDLKLPSLTMHLPVSQTAMKLRPSLVSNDTHSVSESDHRPGKRR